MEENKQRLIAILKKMLELAKEEDSKSVSKINQDNFIPLFDETFDPNGENYEEWRFYDMARNQIINSLTNLLSEKRKKEFLKEAKNILTC